MDSFEELNKNVDNLLNRVSFMEDLLENNKAEIENLKNSLIAEKKSKQKLVDVMKAKDDFFKKNSLQSELALEKALTDLENCRSDIDICNKRVKTGLISKKSLLKKEIDLARQREEERKSVGSGGGITTLSKRDLSKIQQGEKQLIAIQKEIDSLT